MQSHVFDIDVAKEFGVNESILIRHFQFWLSKNRASGQHYHHNRTWSYASVRGMAELFPYWSKDVIRRLLESLVRTGVMITGNYNQTTYDRTLWYAFNDENRFLGTAKSIWPNTQIEMGEHTIRTGETAQPIPDIRTDVRTDKKKGNTPVDDRRQPFSDFMFNSLREIGIEPITDASDWKSLTVMLHKTRGKPQFSLDKLQEYFRRFTHSQDQFDQNQGRPVRFFCNNINKFMPRLPMKPVKEPNKYDRFVKG